MSIIEPSDSGLHSPIIPFRLRPGSQQFAQWVSAYFEHGDLSKHDPNVLSYVVPSVIHPPSIFKLSLAEFKAIVVADGPAMADLAFIGLVPVLEANYRKALFDTKTQGLLPHMKVWLFTGDLSPAFALSTLFTIQDDSISAGGNFVEFKVIPGINHFVHWDDPSNALEIYAQRIRA